MKTYEMRHAMVFQMPRGVRTPWLDAFNEWLNQDDKVGTCIGIQTCPFNSTGIMATFVWRVDEHGKVVE